MVSKSMPVSELWTIRTLANSALVYLYLDHWSIRTPTTGQFGYFLIGQFGPKKEKKIGQFGPFLLVNWDLFHWSIRTFSFSPFGPFPLVNLDFCIMHFP